MNSYLVNYYDHEYKGAALCVTATNAYDARNEAMLSMPFLRMYPARIYSISLLATNLHTSDGSIH